MDITVRRAGVGDPSSPRRAARWRSTPAHRCRSKAIRPAPGAGLAARAYGKREALVLHAVGLPYRERSHFDARRTCSRRRHAAARARRRLARPRPRPRRPRHRAGHRRAAGAARAGLADTWSPSTLPDPSADLVARLRSSLAAMLRRRTLGPPPKRCAWTGPCLPMPMPATTGGRRQAAQQALRATGTARRGVPSPNRPGPRVAVLELRRRWIRKTRRQLTARPRTGRCARSMPGLAALPEGPDGQQASGATAWWSCWRFGP